MTRRKKQPEVNEEFIYSAPGPKAKPFWKKRRFLVPVIAGILGGVFHVKNPEVLVNMAADVHKNLQGHSTD